MMSQQPAAKRLHLSPPSHVTHGNVSSIVLEAQAIPFPWADAVPKQIHQWLEMYAKSHNTAPEYIFVGALVTTAAIMGPKSCVRVRETYQEPTNLFSISVGFPGSGKSQAYGMTVREPLQSLESPMSTMLVDDYTKKGLFRHLQSHDGRALLAHEEMGAFFDQVQKRQLEGNAERQLYCRLYDGGQWVTSTGLRKSEGRQETTQNCVCIHGYVQPQPFIERIYPQLTESDDGFVDRLLVCFPKTYILLEEGVDEWCKKLHASPLRSLVKPFELIATWHKEGEHSYSFDEEGMQVYRSFANEMADVVNLQWESGVMNQGNVSKDKRTMIRLSGVIHIFYEAMNLCLGPSTTIASDFPAGEDDDPLSPALSEELPLSPPLARSEPSDFPAVEDDDPLSPALSEELPLSPPLARSEPDAAGTVNPCTSINETESRMSVALTEYFQDQRKVYEQARSSRYLRGTSSKEAAPIPQRSIALSIFLTKGAFCTPRSVIRSITYRKKPTTVEIVNQMKELSEDEMGVYVETEKEKAFYKLLPIDENREMISKLTNFEDYEENFKDIDTKLITEAQKKRLLARSPDRDILTTEYGYTI